MRDTTRRVFNNLFVQNEGEPGANFTALTADDDFQSDGNLFWSLAGTPKAAAEIFGKFRASPLFEASKKQYAPGWGSGDLVVDPKFRSLGDDQKNPKDLRLGPGSPAIAAGVPVPAEWPDPLRATKPGAPDIGALPAGSDVPGFGIHHRIGLDGLPTQQ